MAAIASVIDISLNFPQIIKIAQTKSSAGVSMKMIAIWLFSDSYKSVYFIIKEQPLQFIVTGICQSILDVVLLTMMIYYRPKD